MNTRKIILSITLALAAIAVAAGPASATADSRSGYAGNVAAPVTRGSSMTDGSAQILMPGRNFTESAAWGSYRQRVCATYRIYRWDLDDYGDYDWIKDGQTSECVNLRAQDRGGRFRGVNFTGRDAGYAYSVDAYYTWQNPSGAVVGSRYADSRYTSDYICATYDCTVELSDDEGAYLTFEY